MSSWMSSGSLNLQPNPPDKDGEDKTVLKGQLWGRQGNHSWVRNTFSDSYGVKLDEAAGCLL